MDNNSNKKNRRYTASPGNFSSVRNASNKIQHETSRRKKAAPQAILNLEQFRAEYEAAQIREKEEARQREIEKERLRQLKLEQEREEEEARQREIQLQKAREEEERRARELEIQRKREAREARERAEQAARARAFEEERRRRQELKRIAQEEEERMRAILSERLRKEQEETLRAEMEAMRKQEEMSAQFAMVEQALNTELDSLDLDRVRKRNTAETELEDSQEELQEVDLHSSDEEVSDEDIFNEEPSDEDIFDEEPSDEDLFDEEVSDEDAFDKESSNEVTFDEEASSVDALDEEASDENLFDEEVSDEETSAEEAYDEEAFDDEDPWDENPHDKRLRRVKKAKTPEIDFENIEGILLQRIEDIDDEEAQDQASQSDAAREKETSGKEMDEEAAKIIAATEKALGEIREETEERMKKEILEEDGDASKKHTSVAAMKQKLFAFGKSMSSKGKDSRPQAELRPQGSAKNRHELPVRTNRKEADALLGKIVAACLILCMVLNILVKDKTISVIENRELKQMPKATVSDLIDGSFTSEFESYESDQFVGRNLFRNLQIFLRWLGGDRLENGVYLGKDGQLLEVTEKPEEELLQANVDAMNNLAAAYPDKNFQVMMVPDAGTIIPDAYPAYAKKSSQKVDYETVKGMLSERYSWIDVIGMLEEHRDEKLYYKTDHHWTSLGANYAYQAYCSQMGLEPGSFSSCVVSSNFNGVLSSTSGFCSGTKETIEIYLPDSGVQEVVTYVDDQRKTTTLYDEAKLDTKDQYAVFLGGNYPLIDIKTTNSNDKVLLLVKDSFANSMLPFLVTQYKEIIVVDPRYYYGDAEELMNVYPVTDVLFLYSGNTFFKDNNLRGMLEPA